MRRLVVGIFSRGSTELQQTECLAQGMPCGIPWTGAPLGATRGPSRGSQGADLALVSVAVSAMPAQR